MNFSGAERGRQLVTAGVGTLLLIVMGGVLIAGFRLATRMTADVGALQSASALQTYPNMIAQQLTSLRDRLESRAYAGQALADLKATVDALRRRPQEALRGRTRALAAVRPGDAAVAAVRPGGQSGDRLRWPALRRFRRERQLLLRRQAWRTTLT